RWIHEQPSPLGQGLSVRSLPDKPRKPPLTMPPIPLADIHRMTSPAPSELERKYAGIRERTVKLASPLSVEDCCVQSMPEASPVKWHLGHTTWFFETFVLEPYEVPFKPFHDAFRAMFSSYNASGETHPDADRGLFTRPSLSVIQDYRRNVDDRMHRLLA